MQDTLLRALPRAEMTCLRDVGHALHWEAPIAHVEAIGSLVDSERAGLSVEPLSPYPSATP
jgi:hypothetical protein